MHVVLDTNVVVSGILSPTGPPGRLLDLVMDETLQLMVEPRILQDNLEDLAIQVLAYPWPHPLPDPDDAVFLATAKAGIALLVTGNIAHFPPALRGTVEVLKPRVVLVDAVMR
ncbi:putative toxin-antitoxin system toxin component, PIN family [Synechococcus sp. CS-1324]|uniref:putative toxin-antitoxin system toxin component, PIN family n=1 Tax=Synechococcus sp. CS-1324 TaxID=2847980 RepID=UPI000DB41C7A|nr:putative toxin-antitoxin system toxin component, PIN family [Synechococcus sp. CS-1324]MCT0230542.1 putative toxin-antitoxin system toxin component, PIN family [Synechococcus sp. CS-1324]PZV03461.1 MAG: putative toxin-antitoxin system toxin component, PIN family [Cyanobium sp.]